MAVPRSDPESCLPGLAAGQSGRVWYRRRLRR